MGIDDEFINVRGLVAELNLSIGWLKNAMEAHLLWAVFPKDRMTLQYDGPLIIPPTFGLRIATR